MPQIGNIVVNDSVPVAHTFSPVSVIGQVANLADRAGGIPVGYSRLTLALREPTTAQGVYKVTAKLVIPTLETPATGTYPAPQVAFTTQVHVDAMFHGRASLLQRKDAWAQAKNILANATLTSMVENLESVWG